AALVIYTGVTTRTATVSAAVTNGGVWGKRRGAENPPPFFPGVTMAGGRPHGAVFDLRRHWLCSRMRVRRLKWARAGATLCQSGPLSLPHCTILSRQGAARVAGPNGGPQAPSLAGSFDVAGCASRGSACAVRPQLPWLKPAAT